MVTRMEKYNEVEEENMSRTKRNSNIYSSIDMSDFSRIKTNNNVSVISDAPKQIDMEKIKKYINSMNEEPKERRVSITLDDFEEENKIVEEKKPKEYDINTVLERARDNREKDYSKERYKKLDNSEYNILKKIKIEEKEEPEEILNELNTQEKTIVNFINDLSKTKSMPKEDLFSELMGNNENTVVLGAKEDITEELENINKEVDKSKRPLDELTRDLMLENQKLKQLIKDNKEDSDNEEDTDKIEIKKIEIKDEKEEKMNDVDKSFFTNSLSFSKKDFEDNSDFYEEEGSSFFTKFAIALIIIILLATIVIILNYALDLKWF